MLSVFSVQRESGKPTKELVGDTQDHFVIEEEKEVSSTHSLFPVYSLILYAI